ncbi:MAG: MMPL family transporter [Actinobacteria bacterium]|nr:MMPL family transporter [Actinomycetota bacterium]
MSYATLRRSRFERLAAWSYHHRRAALGAWVAVLLGVTAASAAIGSDYHNDFSLPGTESQRAADTLAARAPAQAGDTIQIVVQNRDGLSRPAVRDRVEALLSDVRRLPDVAAVTSPYEDPASTLSPDDTIAYATVALDGVTTDIPKADVLRIVEVAQAAGGDGLRVELGGDPVREAQEATSGGAEGAGMLAALVILVLLFGSLLAASLPLLTAVFAVGSTIGLIVLASHVTDVADFTPPLMMLVGLGVGIDYALLIFSRYRGELLDGASRERAIGTALDTAGRSVFFAGCTVMFALLGLYALGLASLQGMALAVALTVLMTMLAALTLLPALLAVFGHRLERSVRRRASRARHADGERWRRWSAFVQRRPWPALVVAVALLLALSAPALEMPLGFADASTDDPSKTSRQAYDLLAEGFGPGFSGPLVVVAQGGGNAAAELRRTLARTPGIAGVTPPSPAGDGDVATVVAYPTSKPQDEATNDLLARLRDDVLPSLAQRSGGTYLVGGPTAAAADFTAIVNDRLPLFLAVVVGLSALLLMVVFRSVLIPLKAALLNLLTIGASLGVVTLAFEGSGPIEAFGPVMIFAIVFGLSMDYEVFLVSRMHEEWQRTRDAPAAIREGLATTGRVITAAGAIMIVVFGAFVLSPERMLQQFGLGLAVAILLDAFLIRCLIVPAVMRLLGERAWWMPHWLTRRLPRIAPQRGQAAPPIRSTSSSSTAGWRGGVGP